jgi:Coenzyme PQQ synthesis protein D (PqqD)
VTASRYRRRPDVLWRRSLDAVAVLPVGTPDPLTLAGTGPAVWDLLVEWRTLEDLAALLSAAYGTEPETVTADVAPLLESLVAAHAVERDDRGRADGSMVSPG